MSRSYKRTAIIKSVHPKYKKFCKRHSNKKIRKANDVPNYSGFKKLYQSCEIHSFISYCPEKPEWMSQDNWERWYVRK